MIDEMSMLTERLLQNVDTRLRQILKKPQAHFGGVVLVLVGDFFQLPPCGGRPLYRTKALDQFTLIELCTQHRAAGTTAGDEEHRAMINNMRDPALCGAAIEMCLRRCARIGSVEEAGAADAAIVVASNAERAQICGSQVQKMGARLGLPVPKFPLHPEPDMHDELWFPFVPGAPCVVTENISQERGVVNGTRATLHSLAYTDSQAARRLVDAAEPGSIVVVPPPDAVLVTISGFDQPVPLVKSRFREKIPGTQVEFAPWQCELAFAFTYHKVQGATVDRLVLDLNQRPVKLGRLTHSALYVALTRVTSAAGLLLMPERNGGFAHLARLRPDRSLIRWLENKRNGGANRRREREEL